MTKSTSEGIINRHVQKRIRKPPPVVVPLGSWLKDAKEEAFCILIADGVALAIAFERAGFEAKNKSSSAVSLFKQPRVQARVQEIIRARSSHPPISLPEVTDMLKRVYVGAIHDSDYTPAHNAAFSLARLHGLVVDRAQLDVIRRPSREPDAPAEIALSDWIQGLPSAPAVPQGPSLGGSGLLIEASAFGSDFDPTRPSPGATGMETENGAPIGPVTGTPHPGGRTVPMGPELEEGTGIPSAEDLF